MPGDLSAGARASRRRAPPRERGSARCRSPGSSRPRRQARSPRRSARSRPRTSTAGRSTSMSSAATVRIMCPPPMNGGISSSSDAAPVEHADAGRAVGLVAGPGVEVGVDRPEVDRDLGYRLGSVDEHHRAGVMGAPDDLGDRVDRAEHVRDVRDREQLRPRSSSASSASRSSWPSSSTGTYASSASRSWQRSCHGTMFEWCSISVSTTRSPAPTFCRPHVYATRLIAAVALAVKIVSSGRRAEPVGDPAARALVAGRSPPPRADTRRGGSTRATRCSTASSRRSPAAASARSPTNRGRRPGGRRTRAAEPGTRTRRPAMRSSRPQPSCLDALRRRARR